MKCSIITIHHIHNFGSVLQAYSLLYFLKQHGYDAEIIDYRPNYYKYGRNWFITFVGKITNFFHFYIRSKKFNRFIKKYDTLSLRRFKTVSELKAYYENSNNLFITGGDQLWNDYHACGRDNAYKLSFTNANKIACGTSMGRDKFSVNTLKKIACETQSFAGIMLREGINVNQLQPYTNVPISHIIDPVGLIDTEVFRNMSITPEIREPYAVMYLANSSPFLDKAIEFLSNECGLKIVHICGFRKKCKCDILDKNAGPEEILGYIINADFVLSASFHATMFSILFNKQFATILPEAGTNARIEDILKLTGLTSRIIKSEQDLNVLKSRIDFTKTNDIIRNFKTSSQENILNLIYKIQQEA